MSRLGYVILALLAIAFAAYVFWPEDADPDPIERLWLTSRAGEPLAYRVRCAGLEQDVTGKQVRLHGVVRELDEERHSTLWGAIRTLSARRSRIVREVDESALPAYGIDGSRRVEAVGVALRWGRQGNDAYLWDGLTKRLFASDPGVIAALDKAAGRLDRTTLFPRIPSLKQVVCAGVMLEPRNDLWLDVAHPQRPHFNLRVNTLLEQLGEVQAVNLDPTVGTTALELASATLVPGDSAGKVAPIRVAVRQAGPGDSAAAWLVVGDQPAQPLDPVGLATWQQIFADFADDMPADLGVRAIESPLAEVVVLRGTTELFRLQKHGVRDSDDDGLSRWDVSWPGGREVARDDAAAHYALLCDRLHGTSAVRGEARDPADALVFAFRFDAGAGRLPVRVALTQNGAEWDAWTLRHRTVLKGPLDPLLTDPKPDACLDPGLSQRPAYRATKVQRRMHAMAGDETQVFTTDDGHGPWRRTWPKDAAAPVNQLAVDRLVRMLCSARARSVRLLTDADRAVLTAPTLEFMLRFAPLVSRQSDDAMRLDDTVEQDWQVALAHTTEGWRACDGEAGVSWLLDDDVVAVLREPLDDSQVFPIVPALVRAIEVGGPSGRYRLSQEGENWAVSELLPDGTRRTHAADAVEVRRYLRTLATLRSLETPRSVGPAAVVADGAAPLGSVVCELPETGDERAQAVLVVAGVEGGRLRVGARSSRADGQRDNRAVLVAGDAAMVLPPASAFVR
jgi:hypothetical protein